jgi:hypothetical protein
MQNREDASMAPKLVDYLLYEPEDSGILWIKFNRPDRMNALVGTAEENGTVAKVGEFFPSRRRRQPRPSHPHDRRAGARPLRTLAARGRNRRLRRPTG